MLGGRDREIEQSFTAVKVKLPAGRRRANKVSHY